MSVSQYDAKNVSVTVDGVYLTGYGEDTLVTAEKMEDRSTYSVGAQGDVVQNVVNNPLGEIVVTLSQTSPQISFLNELANEGRQVPVWIINKNEGGEMAGGTYGVVNKPAPIELGNEVSTREFTFTILDYCQK